LYCYRKCQTSPGLVCYNNAYKIAPLMPFKKIEAPVNALLSD
jgi:hypothetical protein